MSRRYNNSIVWKYFEKYPNKPDEAVCLICKTNYKHGHGTSNLHEHLRRVHQSKLDADKRKVELEKDWDLRENNINNQPSSSRTANDGHLPISSNERRVETEVHNEFNEPLNKIKKTKQLLLSKRFNEPSLTQKREFDSIIMEMIAGDLQPISFVENDGFRKMVKFLDSRYLENIPSRRTLTRKIMPELYISMKQKIQKVLNETNFIAITFDIWTSLNTDSFLTVTAYLYDIDFKLKTFVLTTEKLKKNHTAQYLYEILLRVFKDWNINEKIVAIVTDSGANIKAAIKKFNKIPHIPCAAHKLNLVVTNALKIKNDMNDEDDYNDDGEDEEWDGIHDLKKLLKKCCSIVTHFKRSEVSHRKLEETLIKLSKPLLKLKQDVLTRWNSSLLMLERLVELKEALTYVMVTFKDGPIMLLQSEWDIIEDIIPLLKPFNLMTIELSGEKYPTLAMVIPLVRGVNIKISSQNMNTVLGRALKENLLENMKEQFGSVENIELSPCFGIATLLDPRFKKFAFINTESANNAVLCVKNELATLLGNQSEPTISTENIMSNEDSQTSNQYSDLWDFLTVEVEQERTQVTSSSHIISAETILNQYISLPLQKRSSVPIDFWTKHRSLLDPLFLVAMKYSVIPATSVPAERVFSKAGEILCAKRNRLDPKNVNILIFLNKNLKQFD